MFAALALPLLASSALAHFTLDYPLTRGFDEDKESQFCGGFPTSATRQPFPLGKAPVWIDSHHKTAAVTAFVSTSANPTDNKDFNATADGKPIPLVTEPFTIPTGEACWYIDFSSLGLGLKNGSEVTLLIEYQGGDGSLFQCTDLVLLDNYTVPSNYTCAKPATGAGANSTAGGANTTAPNTTTNGNSSASATPSPSKGSGAEKLTAGAAAVLLAAAAALL